MQHLVKIQLFETKISLASGYYGLELFTWKNIDSENKFLLTYSATFEVKTYKIKSVGQFKTALSSNFAYFLQIVDLQTINSISCTL